MHFPTFEHIWTGSHNRWLLIICVRHGLLVLFKNLLLIYFGRQESTNFKIGKLSIHDLEENTREDTGTLSYKGYNTIFLMTQEMIFIKKKDSDHSEFKSDSEDGLWMQIYLRMIINVFCLYFLFTWMPNSNLENMCKWI